jgi:hypothetical protein
MSLTIYLILALRCSNHLCTNQDQLFLLLSVVTEHSLFHCFKTTLSGCVDLSVVFSFAFFKQDLAM